MNITICTGPTLPVPAIAGGAVHRFWTQMAPAFVRAGHHVTLIARRFPGQPDREQWLGVDVIREGGFKDTGSAWRNVIKGLWDGRLVKRVLPDADVLVTNDIALPLLLREATRSGRIVVAMGRQPKGQLRWYPRVDGIAAASRSVADRIAKQSPAHSDRTRVLPYAIDTDVFNRHPTQRPADGTFLYAGRIHPEKGLDWLIDAFALVSRRSPRSRLTVVGPWRPDQGGAGAAYRDHLQSRSRDLPVMFLEPEFDPDRLADIYRAHAVLVYPSLADDGETFGLAPLEAMACGAVPIVSNLPCFDEYLSEGKNGWAVDAASPDRPAALAQAMSRAENLPVNMVTAAAATARSYSIPAVADRWLAALTEWATP